MCVGARAYMVGAGVWRTADGADRIVSASQGRSPHMHVGFNHAYVFVVAVVMHRASCRACCSGENDGVG